MDADFSIEILEIEGRYFSFKLDKCDNFLANIIRRTMMIEVPILAVDEVTFIDNKTIFIDDIIEKRLGLIPLVCGKIIKKMKMREECICDSCCEDCSISFTLQESHEDGKEVVTSEDMKIGSVDVFPANFTYKYLGKEIEESIPIVSLGETHKIELYGKIKKGNGSMNAKWNPVCMVVYEEREDGIYFNVETTGSLTPEELIFLTEDIVKKKIREKTLERPKPR